MSLALNIEATTRENSAYRQVLATPGHLQLVVMSLLPGESIGWERHASDQFFRVEAGMGRIDFAEESYWITPSDAAVVRGGDWHNVSNVGSEPLKMYTIYAPPQHPPGTLQMVRPEND